jgi:O-antigen/teichoic acid export membrane protein
LAFKRLAIVNLVAAVVSFCTSISLAYSGYGTNSLAIASVSLNIVTGIGTWLIRTDYKFLLPGFSKWRSLLSFGAQNTAAGIVTTIAMNINDLAIGKILGFTSVAMISRAQGLMNLFHQDFMGAIRNVAFPAFAASHRKNGNLEAQYISSVASITAIAWPFYAFASLFSLELLRLFFGMQWDAAAPMVPWFCLGGAFAATINLVQPLLMALGCINQVTRIEFFLQPLRAISMIAGVWYFQSMMIVAILYAANAFLAIPYHYQVKSQIQLNHYKMLLLVLTKSATLTLFCCAFPISIYFMAPRIESGIPLVYLLFAMVLCACTWLCGLLLLKHPLTTDPVFARYLNKLRFIRPSSI